MGDEAAEAGCRDRFGNGAVIELIVAEHSLLTLAAARWWAAYLASSVAAFWFTTAANHVWSGFIDWQVAWVFIVGGRAGSAGGARPCGEYGQGRGCRAGTLGMQPLHP
jgi:hypothetical protein